MKHKHKAHHGHNEGQMSHHKAHKGEAHHHKEGGVEPMSWGHGEFANMPKEVAMHEYPRNVYGDSVHFRDDMNRLQDDAQQDQKIKRRNVNRGMY